jgi:hypothetical protein
MNPDEFARLQFFPPLREEALSAILAGGDWKPTDEGIYDLLVRIFAKYMERFRRQRALANLSSDHRQFARLPGGHALVLWPPGSTLLRGKHVPDTGNEEDPHCLEELWSKQDFLRPGPSNYDLGAYQGARIIVGGCGPRFHRALKVIQISTELLYRHRANNVLSGHTEPRGSTGKDGPYR